MSDEDCDECNGKGWISCHECRKNGYKWVNCEKCGGSACETCPKCDGSGKVYKMKDPKVEECIIV